MTNRIEAYIGCPTHGALFRLESEAGTNPGVRQHLLIALDGVTAPLDTKVCPTEGCGAVLERVPEPRPTEPAP